MKAVTIVASSKSWNLSIMKSPGWIIRMPPRKRGSGTFTKVKRVMSCTRPAPYQVSIPLRKPFADTVIIDPRAGKH